MRVLQRLALLIGALSVTSCDVTTGVHLIPSSHNYIVGYGSLMQEKSRQRSVPFVKKSYPVVVHGFSRSRLDLATRGLNNSGRGTNYHSMN